MIISTYDSDDLNACLSIFDSNKPKYFHESERNLFKNFLIERPKELYFVLRRDAQIVACGGIYEDDLDIAGLSWGMVHLNFHGEGIGRFLTEFRIQKLKEVFPTHRYKIDTSQHTFEFYKKLGFEESNRVKNGFGLGLDKITMWLK